MVIEYEKVGEIVAIMKTKENKRKIEQNVRKSL